MLIDANVFLGFYCVEMNNAHTLQGCPKTLMQSFSAQNPIYHDRNGVIEFEWGNLVDRYWFKAWLSDQLTNGIIQYIEPLKDLSVESKIKAAGFPSGRDIVYVRVGMGIVNRIGKCDFYTEDLDFYEPSKKGCTSSQRLKILSTSSGKVAKILIKNNLNVSAVP